MKCGQRGVSNYRPCTFIRFKPITIGQAVIALDRAEKAIAGQRPAAHGVGWKIDLPLVGNYVGGVVSAVEDLH